MFPLYSLNERKIINLLRVYYMGLKEFLIECSPKFNQYSKFHEIYRTIYRLTAEHFREVQI